MEIQCFGFVDKGLMSVVQQCKGWGVSAVKPRPTNHINA